MEEEQPSPPQTPSRLVDIRGTDFVVQLPTVKDD